MARLARIGAGEATTCLRVGSSGNRCLNYSDPLGLCASSDGAGGGSEQGSKDTQTENTECQKLADAAGAAAASSSTAEEFARTLGETVADVDGTRASLRTGGRNLLNPDRSLRGGFKAEYGGDEAGQARHFAATVASVPVYGQLGAYIGWYRNEHGNTPGATQEDWNLSRAGFELMAALTPGKPVGPGARPTPAMMRLSGGRVKQWVNSKLCEQKK